jgi:hypothetical protein
VTDFSPRLSVPEEYRHHAKLPEPESKSRGNPLLAKAGGSIPAGNTIEKANRDERYASLLASMQNKGWSQACRVKSAKLAEPPLIAIYNAYPTKAGILPLRRAQPSGRRNYYLGRSRRIAAN